MEVIVKRIPDDVLMHYGVKGQKWGVRRYQKKDGSLTRLGKKRLAEGTTLFPKNNGKQDHSWKHARNRNATADRIAEDMRKELDREYADYIKNNPDFDVTTRSAKDYWMTNLRDKTVAENTREKYTTRFVDEYADATLKDLDIETSPQAKQYAEEWVRKNESYRGIVGRTPSEFQAQSDKKRYERDLRNKELDRVYSDAGKVRSEANAIVSRKYSSTKERNKAIDSLFKKKIREAEKAGDDSLADELQQQWAFVYDDLGGRS